MRSIKDVLKARKNSLETSDRIIELLDIISSIAYTSIVVHESRAHSLRDLDDRGHACCAGERIHSHPVVVDAGRESQNASFLSQRRVWIWMRPFEYKLGTIKVV